MDLKLSIKNSIEELVLASTTHGLPNIIRSRHLVIKLMWTVSFFASVSVCLYLVVNTILNYLSFDVTTNSNLIYEVPVEFPTVSFCNKNRAFQNTTIHQFLIVCTFYKSNCTPDDFVLFREERYGDCYRFNSGFNRLGQRKEILQTIVPGRQNGLKLELFIGLPNESNGPHRDDGYHFYIHNHTVNPTPNEGFSIAPAFLSDMLIDRIITRRLPNPYSNCLPLEDMKLKYSDSIYFKILTSQNYTYRQRDCLDMCIKDVFNNTESNYLDICSPHCPTECETTTFTILTSLSDYPSWTRYKNLLKNSVIKNQLANVNSSLITYDYVRKCVVGVFIYYSELKYTLISESEKILLVDLISNIGGTLGLFIGISFLSFLEIFEVLFEIICIFITRKKNEEKVFSMNSYF